MPTRRAHDVFSSAAASKKALKIDPHSTLQDRNIAPLNEQAGLLNMIDHLRKTNQSLEELAYSCAHDLRGPLRNIAGFAELLEARSADALDPMSQEYLQFINRSVKAMQNILEANLSQRLDSPHLLRHENVSIDGVLSDVKATLMRTILERNVTIHHPAKMPTLPGNRTKIFQLFQNLLQNAIKFTPSKPPVIRISVEDHATHWNFFVSDNGIGIAEADIEHVFGMFNRSSHHPQIDGHGIGLAICSQVVADHQGTIWVKSTLGKGTCFCFTLAKNL
jgi:light-regulated signal transduction histidine kinase (bacteriophytochrome)